MSNKIFLVVDPGIDGACAISLAINDPDLDVLGVAASAGNVSGEVATRNVHIVIEQIDPPRWPRFGAALSVDYDTDGTRLHGSNGLGNNDFPVAKLHHPHQSDRLLVEMIRQHPKEVTVVCMAPLTVLARALDRDQELLLLAKRFICLGGTLHEPGNAGPVSEFHFYCDPMAARQVLRSGAPITLIPLDVMRKLLFAPTTLMELPGQESRTCQFLRRILPFGIAATSNLYGIEGFHLKDVAGIVAAAHPELLTVKPMAVDVETRAELTRGMSVVDQRRWHHPRPNADVAVDIDVPSVREYMASILAQCN